MNSLMEISCDFDDYEEESEYSQEQEKEMLFFATAFYGDAKYLAKQYIYQFFQDKRLFCGGKIPYKLLLEDNNISIVLDYDIINSVKRAYNSLKDHSVSSESLGEVTGDIRLVSGILADLAKSNVPQQFAGGMMLLYLKLVEGINIG